MTDDRLALFFLGMWLPPVVLFWVVVARWIF